MKNIVKIVLLCVMGVYLMSGLAAVLSAAFPTAPTSAVAISATTSPKESSEPKKTGYIIKTVRGKVAVADASTDKIIRVTDTRTAILPEKDRAELKKGISVQSESELRSILEDLCS